MIHSYIKEEADLNQLTASIQSSAITIALDYIDKTGSDLTITFKAVLPAPEILLLDGIVANHVPVELPAELLNVSLDAPKTTTGFLKVSTFEPEGGAATLVSVNFADKCSWYMGAVQVTNGALTNSGLVYSSAIAKTHWIDLEHGRLYDEDNILALSDNTYKVKVFVDSVEVLTGFAIDYEAGTVTFEAEPSGTVTASYWYADKSWYRIRPKVGKVISVKAAEVQFAQGTQLESPFVFCPWFVDHPLYGTMEIPGQRIVYKNFKDFISACNEGQDLIPAIGDVTQPVHVFPFNYVRPKPIKYTDYIEIRVYCANHEPVGGPAKYATATFYITVDDL